MVKMKMYLELSIIKNGDKFEGEFKQGNNRAGIFYSKFGFKYGENFNEGFFNKVFYYL